MEMQELLDHLADARCEELRFEVAKLLAAVGKGTLFPGARNYIRRQNEFDAAVERLRTMVGDVEDIDL